MSKIATVLVTAVVVITALVLAVVIVAYSGAINVAATRDHLPGVDWFMSTVQENSVHDYAEQAVADGEIRVPSVDDPAMRETGLVHYQEMCVTCHGAPGVGRSEIGKGLNPEPPDLSTVLKENEPAETFWIVKHGIRMTGMPAFGKTHSDDEVWAIVAFLDELPMLGPSEYARRVEAAGLELSGHGVHGHAPATRTRRRPSTMSTASRKTTSTVPEESTSERQTPLVAAPPQPCERRVIHQAATRPKTTWAKIDTQFLALANHGNTAVNT